MKCHDFGLTPRLSVLQALLCLYVPHVAWLLPIHLSSNLCNTQCTYLHARVHVPKLGLKLGLSCQLMGVPRGDQFFGASIDNLEFP